MVNFGPLAAEIVSLVWGTPANFNGFRILAALLHGTLVVVVSQILRRWTEGATYIRQGVHHVGHWPTFLVLYDFFSLNLHGYLLVVSCSISHGLLWLPGALSWLQISSSTSAMLIKFLIDLGHPLSTFLFTFCLESVRLIKLLIPPKDHLLTGNSLNIFFAP